MPSATTPPSHQFAHQKGCCATGLGAVRPDEEDLRVDLIDVNGQGCARFVVDSSAPVALRRIVPLLESLDIEALDEHTSRRATAAGTDRHVYEFSVEAGDLARRGISAQRVTEQVVSAFRAMWTGLADVDAFNALVLAADLTWQQVSVLRAIGRFLGQSTLPYGPTRIQQILLDHSDVARALVEMFEARFSDPDVGVADPARLARVDTARAALMTHLQQVINLDADRILRAYGSFIDATVRTNAYLDDALSPTRPWVAFKFRPSAIEVLPLPRPHWEI